jgi:hypothetical protein
MAWFKHISIVFVLVVAVFGCKPEPVFPTEPKLSFTKYIQNDNSDSLQVIFSFTDGDGDIGVSAGATDSNMVLQLYVPAGSGGFVPQPNLMNQGQFIYYNYRIPQLTASQKGLEGDLYLTVNKAFITRDTIRFNAYLIDQAQNRSEIVETPSVILLR